MNTAIDIAEYVIDYEHKNGRSVSNLRLQKLLYFVQLKVIAETDISCFADRIEAWPFGPVVPAVYHKYKIFGAFDIYRHTMNVYVRNVIAEKICKYTNSMLDYCAKYADYQLVSISHSQLPWKNAYARGTGTEITIESIKQFVKTLRNE